MSKTNSAWIFRRSANRPGENIFLDISVGFCKSLTIDLISGLTEENRVFRVRGCIRPVCVRDKGGDGVGDGAPALV